MSRFVLLDLSVQLIAALRPIADDIARHDRDLSRQLKRASSSVPLNIAEGNRRGGQDRTHHLRIAAGSAAETRVALQVAAGWGYASAPPEIDRMLDSILAI